MLIVGALALSTSCSGTSSEGSKGDPSTNGGGDSVSGGDGVSGADAGPTCTELVDIPTPVRPDANSALQCTADTPCGGDLESATWAYIDVCLDQDVIFEDAFAMCPSAQLNGLSVDNVDGSLVFSGGEATHTVSIQATGVFQMPATCAGCDCNGFQANLRTSGMPTAFCYVDCYPDSSCRCLIDVDISFTETETYTASGNSFTTAGGRVFDYCVDANGLSLAETSGSPLIPGTVSLVPTEDLNTPEICDGKDNDNNGSIDDNPIDCPPPCNVLGECADVDYVCGGFWRCEYNSTALETGDETICDGLDNDCDGEVDEDLIGCVEVCDGLDNDNNGTVDDNLTDVGCPTLDGVCTAGVTATCLGASGWQCDYTSTSYEVAETSCDGQDNDCDGQVDEGCNCTTGQSKIFVLHDGTTPPAITRANLDGSNPEMIVDLTGLIARDLVIDPLAEKLYYKEGYSQEIRRVSLDGSNPEAVAVVDTQEWELDPADGRIFTECSFFNVCFIDIGSGLANATLVPGARVAGFDYDPFFRRIYWSDHNTSPRSIKHADWDGANETTANALGSSPVEFAVDAKSGLFYWASGTGIHRSDLDGDNPIELISSPGNGVSGMIVDLIGGKIYFTEDSGGRAARANLDGSNVETLMTVTGADEIAIYRCIP